MRYPKRESVAIVAIILAAMAGDAARAADVRIPQAQYNANPPVYYEPEVLVPYEPPLLYGYPPPPPPVYRIGPSRAFLSSTLLRPMVPSPALWGIRWAYRERAARLRPPILEGSACYERWGCHVANLYRRFRHQPRWPSIGESVHAPSPGSPRGFFLYRLLTVGGPPWRVGPDTPDTDHSAKTPADGRPAGVFFASAYQD